MIVVRFSTNSGDCQRVKYEQELLNRIVGVSIVDCIKNLIIKWAVLSNV